MATTPYRDTYDGQQYQVNVDTATPSLNLREDILNTEQASLTGTNSRLRSILYMWGQAVEQLYGYAGGNPFDNKGLATASDDDKAALGTLGSTFESTTTGQRMVLSDGGLANEPPNQQDCEAEIPVTQLANLWQTISDNIQYDDNGTTNMDFTYAMSNTPLNQTRNYGEFAGNLWSMQIYDKAAGSESGAVQDNTLRLVVSTEVANLLAPFPYAVSSGDGDNYPYGTNEFHENAPPKLTDLPDLLTTNPFYVNNTNINNEKYSLAYSFGRLWQVMQTDGLLLFSVQATDANSEELFISGTPPDEVEGLRYYTRTANGEIIKNYYFVNDVAEGPQEFVDPEETAALFCPPICRTVNRLDLEALLLVFGGNVQGNVLTLDLNDGNVIDNGIFYSGDKPSGNNNPISNVNATASQTGFSLTYAVKKADSSDLGDTIFKGSSKALTLGSISQNLVGTQLSTLHNFTAVRGVEVGTLVSVIEESAFKPDPSNLVSNLLTEITFRSHTDSALIEIDHSAFENCSLAVNQLHLPSSLVTIGSNAFLNCHSLPSYVFTDCTALEVIGPRAFAFNSGAAGRIYIPERVDLIGTAAFAYNSNIQQIQLQDAALLEDIDNSAFLRCGGATNTLIIPQSVLRIDNQAFGECFSLQSLNLAGASRLTHIGEFAFANCSLARGELTIPQSVLTIEINAFDTCRSLASINLAGAAQLTGMGVNSFRACNQVSGNLIFPSRLRAIGPQAFQGFTNVQSIGLANADALTAIDRLAFYQCSRATGELTIPQSVLTMDLAAFYQCVSLQSINLAGATQLTGIGVQAFRDCGRATGELTIPQSVLTMDLAAFYQCGSLQSINLADASQLTGIGSYAFYACTRAAGELTIPQSVLTIGESAFRECTSLASINLAGATQLTAFDPTAFTNCNQISGNLVFPPKLKEIDDNVFRDFTNVQSIGLDSAGDLTRIGASAFSGCVAAAGAIKIPANVHTIATQAFDQCLGIEHINLVDAQSLTGIGGYAFENCAIATGQLYIPAGVEKIDDRAFALCKEIVSLNLNDAVSLATIGGQAFQEATKLTGAITLPASLRAINYQAFKENNQITKLDFSGASNLQIIDAGAFDGCHGCEGTLVFPGSIVTIGIEAFAGLANVDAVTFLPHRSGVAQTLTFQTGLQNQFAGMALTDNSGIALTELTELTRDGSNSIVFSKP
jgi:hypothetical protein